MYALLCSARPFLLFLLTSSLPCASVHSDFSAVEFLLSFRCVLTDRHSVGDMNLSSLLHNGQKHSRQQDPPRSSQSFPNPRVRNLHGHRRDMASALTASPYINQSPIYTRSPQPPPSPPIDEPNNLRTLPSIQSLIGMDVAPLSDEQHCESSSHCKQTCEAHQIRSGRRRPANRATTAQRRASNCRPSAAYIRSTNREQPKCSTAITSH